MGFGPALAIILLPISVAPNETGREEQVPPFLFSLLAFGVAHQLRDCECFGRQVTYHTTVVVAAIFSGFVGGNCKIKNPFAEIFPLSGGVGLTSLAAVPQRSAAIEDAPHAVGIKLLEPKLIGPDRGDRAKGCALALQSLAAG